MKEELTKQEVIDLICSEYEKHSIKPTKMRIILTMYLLYGYWGGKFSKILPEDLSTEYIKKLGFKEELFKADFTAYIYGPTDLEIFNENDENINNKESQKKSIQRIDDHFSKNNEPLKYLKEIIKELATHSDFTLTDIAHADNVWNMAYHSESKKMDNNAIIAEYVLKQL